MRFDHPAARQLVRLLPRLIHVETWSSPHAEWLDSTLRLVAAESGEMRPGGETVLTRLADILVIQAIRSWIDRDPSARTGWLGALRDERIGPAILGIHRDPARDWTVESLAREVAMSRSAFSRAFKRVQGVSPGSYRRRARAQGA